MIMQLDTSEVQTAITEYLRKRGVIIEDPRQVHLSIISQHGEHRNIVGCSPVVVVLDAKLPAEGPYR
jgi:hypothetical protein